MPSFDDIEILEAERDGYLISSDPSKLDLPAIHRYLSEESYWSKGIPFEVVQRAVRGSLCFGIYWQDQQVGFARAITDCATFAYLADVFILEPHRGRGLSKRLLALIQAHPVLQGLRTWMLATYDAHGLYAQFGFKVLEKPERWMAIRDPEIYTRKRAG